MCRSATAVLCVIVMLASAGLAQATIATYEDFTAYAIRNGVSGSYTTGVASDDTAETFTVTAVGGGKVAVGTSAINGAKVSDLTHMKFTNSATATGSQIVYLNFWVTDGNPLHYALVAVNVDINKVQDDVPVYTTMTSSAGMDATYFEGLAVRVYATNTSSLSWIYDGAVRMQKFYGFAQSLWKSASDTVDDPILVSDIGDLHFGSPFTTTTVPGVVGNSEWPYVGTGDPQTPDSLYLMCGDTSGSVATYGYTLSDISLEWGISDTEDGSVPEPASLAVWSLLGLAGIGLRRRNRKQDSAA